MYLVAFATFCWGLVIAYLLIPTASKIAQNYGLVDKPVGRKQHVGIVPIVGGIVICAAAFSAVALAAIFLNYAAPTAVITFLVLSLVLLVFGVIDDLKGLSSIFRLVLQVFVASCMVYFAGISIESVGQLIPGIDANLSGVAALVFTIMCTVGVVNAINMIDGVDGLSGSILLIAFSTMSALAFTAGDMFGLVVTSSISGALLAFLYFNSRVVQSKAVIFMGDAGSTVLGFVLVWFFIQYSQGENAVLSPISAGWIFGLPLADTICVMVRRITNAQSPFSPGRDHFHHQLLDNGFTVPATVRLMAFIQCGLTVIGIGFNSNASLQPVLFWLFIALVLVHFFFTERIILRVSSRAKRVNA